MKTHNYDDVSARDLAHLILAPPPMSPHAPAEDFQAYISDATRAVINDRKGNDPVWGRIPSADIVKILLSTPIEAGETAIRYRDRLAIAVNDVLVRARQPKKR